MKPLVCESQFQNPNKEIQSIKKVAREKDNIQKPYDEQIRDGKSLIAERVYRRKAMTLGKAIFNSDERERVTVTQSWLLTVI